jgi:hypothetical protein
MAKTELDRRSHLRFPCGRPTSALSPHFTKDEVDRRTNSTTTRSDAVTTIGAFSVEPGFANSEPSAGVDGCCCSSPYRACHYAIDKDAAELRRFPALPNASPEPNRGGSTK